MEVKMALRLMVPFRERTPLARPDFDPFSPLSREIGRLIEEFSRSLSAVGGVTTPGLPPGQT
jgi:hypothetical protein